MTADDRLLRRARRLLSTVRFRVTALATLTLVGVLAAAGFGLVVAQERLLRENLDEAIAQGADSIEAAVVSGRVPATLGGFGDDDTRAQVVTAAGDVAAATPNVDGQPPFSAPPPSGQTEALHTVDDLPGDDSAYRVLTRRVGGSDSSSVIHVAGTMDDIEESTGVLVLSLTIALPLVAALLGVLVWWLVGRTLQPVEAIRAEVAAISGAALDRRVPQPGSDDEIARLAQTMNAMLDRVQSAARQQQQFVADASHELRSPLTRIRSELEVDLAHLDGADLAATHRSVLDEALGLQRLVEDLLHLARSDAGAADTRQDAVDLDDIVLAQAADLRSARVTVDTTRVTAAQVHGDAGQLARAVSNMAGNAARHATSGVSFTLTEHENSAVLAVSDDGPGIPPHQHDRVFERFTRLDDSRQGATGGSGLGLAIAREIIERHRGTITIDPDHTPGARFVVTLPLHVGPLPHSTR